MQGLTAAFGIPKDIWFTGAAFPCPVLTSLAREMDLMGTKKEMKRYRYSANWLPILRGSHLGVSN